MILFVPVHWRVVVAYVAKDFLVACQEVIGMLRNINDVFYSFAFIGEKIFVLNLDRRFMVLSYLIIL
jgi:hypothetical protein